MNPNTRPWALLLVLVLTSGCTGPSYYWQALSGQLEILNKRRPVESVLNDPATTADVRQKLELVKQLRNFASQRLALPENDSYRSYADLQRPFALWNVFATPEFSLEPKNWCFLFAGCVSYRGYFAQDRAEQFADELKQGGFDVYVGGVLAYSTLGWFSDPVLNTFLGRSEADLAGLLFHELAHQVVYVPGDSAFNESFATVVELEGVQRWYEQQGSADQVRMYQQNLEQRTQFTAMVMRYKERLTKLYHGPMSDPEKRAAKQRVFDELRAEHKRLKTSWGGTSRFDQWMAQDLNNAHLSAIGLYHQHVPALTTLLRQLRGDYGAFYRRIKELANMSQPDRDRTLASFLSNADNRAQSAPAESTMQ